MGTLSEAETAVYRQTYQQRLARQHQAREERRQEALTAVTTTLPQVAAAIPSACFRLKSARI